MKILVVDDEPAIREVISAVLRHRQMEIVTAASGDEAVARFLEGGVDMMILDQRMPGMSGAELHGILSQEFASETHGGGVTPGGLPPVLIVTGAPDDEVLGSAEWGEAFVGVLPKPFDVEVLVQTVEQAVRRHRSPAVPSAC